MFGIFPYTHSLWSVGLEIHTYAMSGCLNYPIHRLRMFENISLHELLMLKLSHTLAVDV
jgi:hypothetical protein